LRLTSAYFFCFDVAEYRILNFIECLPHRGAESHTVTIDLAEGVIATCLRPRASGGHLESAWIPFGVRL
jgi:hypothetical protein